MRFAHLALVSLSALTTLFGTAACTEKTQDSPGNWGTLQMPLTASSTSGATYRLRNATFRVTGASNSTIFSEEHLDQSSIEIDLNAGNYLIKLTNGWTLEKLVDGTPTEVEAILGSDNPASFSITDQQITPVQFVFRSGDDVIQFGKGRLELGIVVDDGPGNPSEENTEAACADGLDNDGDGLTDCEDDECGGFPDCVGNSEEASDAACSDGLDNDGDGLTDCEDDQCSGFPDCVGNSEEASDAACSDGLDNDGDGLTDCEDDQCAALNVCFGTLLYSYVDQPSGAVTGAGIGGQESVIVTGTRFLRINGQGAAIQNVDLSPFALTDVVSSVMFDRIFVAGSNSNTVSVSRFSTDPTVGVEFEAQRSGSGVESQSVRVIPSPGSGAVFSFDETNGTTVTSVDGSGIEQWSTTVSRVGSTVELLSTPDGFQILQTDVGSFTMVALDGAGNELTTTTTALSPPARAIGIVPSGSNFLIYVEHQGELIAYENDASGANLGVTPLANFMQPLAHVETNSSGQLAFASPDGVFLFETDGSSRFQQPAPSGQQFTDIFFTAEGDLCTASTGDETRVSCYDTN